MTKRVLILAGAMALSAPALADTPLKFERDGITYVGSIADRDGAKIITGRELGSNRAFNLRVVNGRVTGDYAGDYVSYVVPADTRIVTR